jgi:hypothetical protein
MHVQACTPRINVFGEIKSITEHVNQTLEKPKNVYVCMYVHTYIHACIHRSNSIFVLQKFMEMPDFLGLASAQDLSCSWHSPPNNGGRWSDVVTKG